MAEDPRKEFVLSTLRVASARCKLMDNEITSIGVALRNDMVGPERAMKWVRDLGLMTLIEPIPSDVAAITAEVESPDAV